MTDSGRDCKRQQRYQVAINHCHFQIISLKKDREGARLAGSLIEMERRLDGEWTDEEIIRSFVD